MDRLQQLKPHINHYQMLFTLVVRLLWRVLIMFCTFCFTFHPAVHWFSSPSLAVYICFLSLYLVSSLYHHTEDYTVEVSSASFVIWEFSLAVACVLILWLSVSGGSFKFSNTQINFINLFVKLWCLWTDSGRGCGRGRRSHLVGAAGCRSRRVLCWEWMGRWRCAVPHSGSL